MKKIKLFLQSFPMSGKIFYVPSLHQFIQVKCIYLRGAECGGFANYYEDSITNICRQFLSYDFLADCILVGLVDKFKFAKQECIGGDWFAWRAK